MAISDLLYKDDGFGIALLIVTGIVVLISEPIAAPLNLVLGFGVIFFGSVRFGFTLFFAFGLGVGASLGFAAGPIAVERLNALLSGLLPGALIGSIGFTLADRELILLSQGWTLGFILTFFRIYYFPFHFFWIWPRLRGKSYRSHPVAWDDVWHLPLPGLDRLLVAYAELDPEAGRREIDRLIDSYPSQRQAALRSKAIMVARGAAAVENLSLLDDSLAGLPEGNRGFLAQTAEIRLHVHEVAALKARLDTLDRPFLREPFAALLVKEVETFEQRIAGFKPPLSTEFREAARKWLVIASRELESARSALAREPTRQVFRAGDPVDREREAFVLRGSISGELERQVMLATGCPGLLVYGRRRMGKSTLLRNLEGFLPPRALMVQVSMQQARAFSSLTGLLTLLGSRLAAAVDGTPDSPTNLAELEGFLDATQKRLASGDRRVLLAIDEYENLDRKIGEGILPEDLLAVIRESIQSHRQIIWAFAGSHAIDELTEAPWTSYLVSARTVEVTPFEPEETRLLLTEPLRHSPLWRDADAERPRFEPGFWGEGGTERIHEVTGGWPHLVQLVAETAVDLVNNAGVASMDGALFGRALSKAVVRGNNVFIELMEKESRLPGEWDYLRMFRRFEEQDVPEDEAVARSLRRRLLVVDDGGRFRLRVPLMARWLRERI